MRNIIDQSAQLPPPSGGVAPGRYAQQRVAASSRELPGAAFQRTLKIPPQIYSQRCCRSLHFAAVSPIKSAHDLVAEAKAHIHEVDLRDAELAIGEADALIDVREPDEFAQGHIRGTVNIPRGLLEFKLSATQELAPRDLKLVLYCKTSGRAALAAANLKQMG